MTVTNQKIQVTEGVRLIVNCGGGQNGPNPNWKLGVTNITTNKSANVYQFRHGLAALFIKSVNPSNVGTYTCHIGTIQERVTFGESLI